MIEKNVFIETSTTFSPPTTTFSRTTTISSTTTMSSPTTITLPSWKMKLTTKPYLNKEGQGIPFISESWKRFWKRIGDMTNHSMG